MHHPGEQSEDKGTDKRDGSELHNGLLYCYKGTNITWEKAVKDPKTQLNDALIASQQYFVLITAFLRP